MTQTDPQYVLGSSDQEIARLDGQAASIEAATRLLLRAAGTGPGMRVLDLGTGLGHVARLVADLVGPGGQVVGLDTNTRLLEVARARTRDHRQVTFVEGDVRGWRAPEPFDAVVGRLILFHLPDAGATLRHQLAALRPGGLMLMLDFDLGSSRAEPAVPLVTQALEWVNAAFRSAGANPVIGTRLALLLAGAGLTDVQTFGVQGYLAPDDPRGAALLGGVVRAVAPWIVAAGIATPEQIDIGTLQQRIAADTEVTDSVVLPPALVGAWGQRAT